MPDYQKLYHNLFNTITDCIQALQTAQQQAEELYLQSSERTKLDLQPYLRKINTRGGIRGAAQETLIIAESASGG